MKRIFRIFFSEDVGQDLVEYTLLIAFVALTSAGLFLGTGTSVSQIWSSANTVLATAAGSPGNGGGGGGGDQGGGGDHGH